VRSSGKSQLRIDLCRIAATALSRVALEQQPVTGCNGIIEATMPLEATLKRVLTGPSPDALWSLRADLLLLADRLPPIERGFADSSLAIAGEFHHYLIELQSRMTAHEFSQLASRLDIGSVGLLALQDLVTDRERLFKKLFLGGLSEGLMVLATLQYSKAWKTEVMLVNDEALWRLFDGFWQLSRQLRPDLPAEVRRAQIEGLLAPLRSPDVEPSVKAAVIARLFQVLLVASLTWVGTGVRAASGQ
jgi:hypothetical protein